VTSLSSTWEHKLLHQPQAYATAGFRRKQVHLDKQKHGTQRIGHLGNVKSLETPKGLHALQAVNQARHYC
jgi:hypothetical protein